MTMVIVLGESLVLIEELKKEGDDAKKKKKKKSIFCFVCFFLSFFSLLTLN